ncbi:VWA domain-containing protein [Rhodococcoides kroppenstedtii]|uniref:VWA domain-containing protein n=1 Tax=Rhodococcoides kroppenstedtii TaxID=293050 RepID=UPI003643E68E
MQIVTLLGLMLVGVGPAAAEETNVASSDVRDGPVLVVMDTSSSMSETWADSSGSGSKIDAARTTITKVVQGLTPGSDFGLIAYPGAVAADSSGCSRGKEEIKVGPLDPIGAAAAVRRLQPNGDTPTAPALRHAAERLQASKGSGTIILVSDGESNCGSEAVCDVARDLGQSGLSVQVNTVGLQISEAGRTELECVAQAGNGQYLSADDEAALTSVITDLAGARLELAATVPTTMAAVAGSGTGGTPVEVTVTASGQYRSNDVRVSLRFDQAGRPGSVTVPRPVFFLGNLEPGTTRKVVFTVRPDQRSAGVHDWVVNATASNAMAEPRTGKATVTADPDQLTGVLAGIERALIVGDSYASGEGVGTYAEGSRGVGNESACHKADSAYGYLLFPGTESRMIACSGAVTADFYQSQRSGRQDEYEDRIPQPPQLSVLRGEALASKQTTAVLVSIGGNDVGFADFVIACIFRPAACGPKSTTSWPSTFGSGIAGATNSIMRVYRDVDRAVNDSTALQHRGGQVAPIVVVPYPRIVPTPSAATGGCQLGVSAQDISGINEMIDMLNAVLRTGVQTLSGQGRPFYYASDVVEAFQPDHTICDREPFAVAKSDIVGTVVEGWWDSELIHPNAAGHAAMARAIGAWSAATPTRTFGPATAFKSREARVLGEFEDWRYVFMSPGKAYEAGAPAIIDANGFAPTSTVVFRIQSVPFVLGSSEVGRDGAASAEVVIPDGVPPGLHTVIASGFDPDGNPVEHSYRVFVGPQGSLAALAGLVFGVVVLVVSLFGFRSARRRRAAQVAR